MNSTNRIGKGMIVILFANIVNLMVSVIRGFILPKYLSIDSFALIKVYQLYISYAGLAALGFIDGMYLKYGGKELAKIDLGKFSTNLSSFRIFQSVISLFIVFIGITIKDKILVAVGITTVALNLTDYYKSFFQAVGHFLKYSRIMNVSAISLLIVNLVLIFVFHSDNAYLYIVSYVVIYYIVYVLLEITLRRNKMVQKPDLFFSFNECKESVFSGFALMCGTLMSTFMMGMDRWFVIATSSNYDFAVYSFAASCVGFLSYAISPVSITLYNFFCGNNEKSVMEKSRRMIVVFCSYIIAAAYPIKFLLENYLDKYYNSIYILFILFASQFIYGIILCYYVNIYKAKKMQNKYFIAIGIVVIFGIVLNIITYIILKRTEAFAIGTMLASVIWMILCCKDFNQYRVSLKEIVYVMISVALFIISGFYCVSYIGFILYCTLITLLALMIMRKDLISMLRFGMKSIFNMISKTTRKKDYI